MPLHFAEIRHKRSFYNPIFSRRESQLSHSLGEWVGTFSEGVPWTKNVHSKIFMDIFFYYSDHPQTSIQGVIVPDVQCAGSQLITVQGYSDHPAQ